MTKFIIPLIRIVSLVACLLYLQFKYDVSHVDSLSVAAVALVWAVATAFEMRYLWEG